MTDRPAPACDIPAPHDGPVRLYPAGWLCSTHSPWRAAGLPEPPPGLDALPPTPKEDTP